MKKTYKIFAVLAFYSLVLVWDGCTLLSPCNCPEINFEFVDYAGFKSAVGNPAIDTTSNRLLEILLIADSVHFVAQCQPNSGLGLMSTAYGCSCPPQGFRGDKFPILGIDVFSNHPYKDDLITESNLNHIFQMEAIDSTGRLSFKPINEINAFPKIQDGEHHFLLQTEEIPDSTGADISYSFDVVITKSDGTILTVTTDEVTWL